MTKRQIILAVTPKIAGAGAQRGLAPASAADVQDPNSPARKTLRMADGAAEYFVQQLGADYDGLEFCSNKLGEWFAGFILERSDNSGQPGAYVRDPSQLPPDDGGHGTQALKQIGRQMFGEPIVEFYNLV